MGLCKYVWVNILTSSHLNLVEWVAVTVHHIFQSNSYHCFNCHKSVFPWPEGPLIINDIMKNLHVLHEVLGKTSHAIPSLSTQQWWVPGGTKIGNIVNGFSCRKCAEFSPEEMRPYERELQYQGCRLESLLNSWGFQTINLYIYIYLFTFTCLTSICLNSIVLSFPGKMHVI